ncbi:hypothetical protein niasHS_002495 [Heterodera schachtii]|uniref:MoaB/Mog domain-containing protein n=1 Tax=Heterodera schachtii TaxID=97005 RepID=A0ABD2KKL6_HETSC
MSFVSPLPSPSVVHRHRQSPWPAIPMAMANKIVEDQFGAVLDKLRHVEEKEASSPDLLGAVLAESVHALAPVPPFRASVKDGYAVIASDGVGARRVIAAHTAKISEGRSAENAIGTGECVRITTGAMVPRGADAIVQVEDTRVLQHNEEEELTVDIMKEPREGQDIRERGSDVAEGQLLLGHGTVLNAAEIGAIALSGRKKVLIYERKVRVSVISTGDELVDFYSSADDHSPPRHGAVTDTNRPVLLSLLRSNGFCPVDFGIVHDNLFALIDSVRKALTHTNILVVTGGVSMGEKDLLKEVLSEHLGLSIHFGRVFVKPGLPATFASGHLSASPPSNPPKFVFALPGNPISAFVTAHLFALPQLRRIAGMDSQWENARLRVKLAHPIGPLDSRPEYRRARLVRLFSADGLPFAECVGGNQCSSRLASALSANILLELPPRDEKRETMLEGETATALIIGPL